MKSRVLSLGKNFLKFIFYQMLCSAEIMVAETQKPIAPSTIFQMKLPDVFCQFDKANKARKITGVKITHKLKPKNKDGRA